MNIFSYTARCQYFRADAISKIAWNDRTGMLTPTVMEEKDFEEVTKQLEKEEIEVKEYLF